MTKKRSRRNWVFKAFISFKQQSELSSVLPNAAASSPVIVTVPESPVPPLNLATTTPNLMSPTSQPSPPTTTNSSSVLPTPSNSSSSSGSSGSNGPSVSSSDLNAYNFKSSAPKKNILFRTISQSEPEMPRLSE